MINPTDNFFVVSFRIRHTRLRVQKINEALDTEHAPEWQPLTYVAGWREPCSPFRGKWRSNKSPCFGGA
jgi:hypothetical protein